MSTAAGAEHLDWLHLVTLLLAFTMLCGLWWVYFAFGPATVQAALEESENRIELIRPVLSYGHLSLIAGIVAIAAGIGQAVANPAEPLPLDTAIHPMAAVPDPRGAASISCHRHPGAVPPDHPGRRGLLGHSAGCRTDHPEHGRERGAAPHAEAPRARPELIPPTGQGQASQNPASCRRRSHLKDVRPPRGEHLADACAQLSPDVKATLGAVQTGGSPGRLRNTPEGEPSSPAGVGRVADPIAG